MHLILGYFLSFGRIHVRQVVTRKTTPHIGAIDPLSVSCHTQNRQVTEDAAPLLGQLAAGLPLPLRFMSTPNLIG